MGSSIFLEEVNLQLHQSREHDARVPVSSDMYVYGLSTDKKWTRLTANGTVPTPRVAHSAVVIGTNIWIFGGRSGVEMGEGAKSDLYIFDTKTSTWAAAAVDESLLPPSRSYHTACACGDVMYVFGGCGAAGAGRLNDLWRLDTKSNQLKWEQMPTNPEIKGRGGSRLIPSPDGKLFVVAGFAGFELSDMYEFDTKSCTWSSLPTDGLPARSVFGAGVHTCDNKQALCQHSGHLIVFGGEIDPSTQGHAGAGDFSDDLLCWDRGQGWHKLSASGSGPCARGWFASTLLPTGDLVIHGGLDCSNKRLGDMFILHMHGKGSEA
uniref:Nitrile-specifier protein 5 n=1 Tax=Dunaliella tertiolecta TaxID=3047 RepID=A0A7S3QY44_DUNTE